MEEFRKLGLSDNIIKALKKKGFTKPTPIQVKAIPLLLAGKKDVVGQAQTGTGKTASFALPIIEKIKEHSRAVQAIVLTPTRELALQVALEISSLKGDKRIKVLPVYGGAPIGPQRQKLRDGVDIVVGTPGRVMDLQKRKSLRLDHIQFAVLDEADEMLNMGFVEDIENILRNTPKDKTMLLFSATMPKAILKIAKKYMRDYELIETGHVATVEQIYYDINAKDRIQGLRRVIDYNVDFYGIVFCNTKANVDNLAQKLAKMDYSAAAIHGDIPQSQREKIIQQFRNKSIKILVATDVAARGIDVNDLTHVVNFSLPQSPEAYIHRIGRTGRAGKKGVAVTFVIPSERRKLHFVERIIDGKIMKRTLPSAKQILEHKEAEIKITIRKIIEANTGKSSKYDLMAETLLKEYKPAEVVSAILKYSFKNQLDVNTYKNISEARQDRTGSGRGKKRPYQKSSRPRFKKESHDKKFGRESTFKKKYGEKKGKSGFRRRKKENVY